MSSVVYYRFRSSKTPQRLTFDGTGISIFDIKRGILLAQHLDSTADTFQLILSNPDTHETYSDDGEVLPRSTLVEVRRLPVARAGGLDSAMHYVSGSLTFNAKNAARREDFSGNQNRQTLEGKTEAEAQDAALAYLAGGGGGSNEQDMMNAMFAQQSSQWSRTQQEMATKTKIYTPMQSNQAYNSEPDKTLPPGYICHRCGQKGHWINNCPSLYDRNWETKKVLRTTGIPRSMLRSAAGLPPSSADGEDDGRTYLMNADGEYVVAVADDKSWKDFQDRQLQQQARAKRSIPEDLKDPISHELMRRPKKMPCCGKVYDEVSVEQALILADFHCPNCGQSEVYIDQLKTDNSIKQRVQEFLASNSDQQVAEGAENAQEEQKEQEDNGSTNEDDVPGYESDDGYTPGLGDSPRSPVSTRSDDEHQEDEVAPDSKRQRTDKDVPVGMPFMLPFMLPVVPGANEDDREISDYDSGDDEPVRGRIR